jgi:hypothetical protein
MVTGFPSAFPRRSLDLYVVGLFLQRPREREISKDSPAAAKNAGGSQNWLYEGSIAPPAGAPCIFHYPARINPV